MTSQSRSTNNRNLILLLPKQPALDWIVSVDTSPSGHLTLDRLRQEQVTCLVLSDHFHLETKAPVVELLFHPDTYSSGV